MKKIETEELYNKIKNKLNDKEYRLGLDLGVGSIGWAILSLEKNGDDFIPKEIIASGSRIFESSQGAENRRLKRLQRNTHRHKRERLFKLWKFLYENKLALKAPDKLEKEDPLNGDTSIKRFSKQTLSKDPYTLRAEALDKKLELYDLGYVIYHIANHRGTASVRTFEEDDDKRKKETQNVKEKANTTAKKLKNYRTYGELIYKEKIKPYEDKIKEIKEGGQKVKDIFKPAIRNVDKVEYILTRDVALAELEEILKSQGRYYPNLITKDFVAKVKELVNFEYDKLVPEPGRCPYFQDEHKLPKSHPLSEERRIWEMLNNIRIMEPVIKKENGEVLSYKERELNGEEKNKLYEILKKQNEMTANKVRTILNLNEKTEVILQGRSKDKLKGYRNIKLESMKFWKRLTNEQKYSFFYYWIQTPDDFQLKRILKEKYNLNNEEIEKAISEIEISKGYSPIGKTATKIFLDYIKSGLSFTEAIDEAVKKKKINIKNVEVYDLLPYYGEILDDLTQPVICKALFEKFQGRNYKKPNTNSDEEKYGRIANPVVHQTLNELRKLVNEIIKITGKKPYEISVEVARELKKSKEEREEINREQNDNERNRQRIYETYCKGQNLGRNTILKFELWEEQDKKCPYCDKKISVDDIYSSRVDIDHIFPISTTYDNSRNNLVLSHNSCNEQKGQKAPYEAFYGTDRWNTILEFVKNCEGMKNKRWRFIYEDSYKKYLENIPIKKRFETDISYISKSATRYLSCLFDKKTKVICYKGGLTAQLRLAWDLNGVLISKSKILNNNGEESNYELNKKFRNDNRHHALDAIVLAYATRGYSNILNKLSGSNYNIDFTQKNWLSKIFIPPNNKTLEDFKREISNVLDNTFISIKHDHNPNGQLLGDTFYQVFLVNHKYLLVSNKKVKDVSVDSLAKLEKELTKGKEEIQKSNNEKLKFIFNKNINVLKTIKNKMEEAKKIIMEEDEKLKNEGKRTYPITEKRIIKKALELTNIRNYYNIQPNKEKEKFFILKEPTQTQIGCGYDTGDNLCVDLYHNKDGKLCGEIIRKIDAMNNKIPNYKKQGYELFERIYQGDILECDVSEDKASLKIKTPNAVGNRCFVKVTTFTELPPYYTGKLDQIQIYFKSIYNDQIKDSFYISSMKKYNVRKVVLTPIGAIKYRSKILEDLNVESNRYIR